MCWLASPPPRADWGPIPWGIPSCTTYMFVGCTDTLTAKETPVGGAGGSRPRLSGRSLRGLRLLRPGGLRLFRSPPACDFATQSSSAHPVEKCPQKSRSGSRSSRRFTVRCTVCRPPSPRLASGDASRRLDPRGLASLLLGARAGLRSGEQATTHMRAGGGSSINQGYVQIYIKLHTRQ